MHVARLLCLPGLETIPKLLMIITTTKAGHQKRWQERSRKDPRSPHIRSLWCPWTYERWTKLKSTINSQPINIHSTKRCFQTPEWLQEMRPNRNKEIQCKTDPDRYPDRKLRELAIAKQNTQTSWLSIAKANPLASQVLATEWTTWGSMVEA